MEVVDFSKVWPQLLGLVPVYAGDGTNGTEILLEKSCTVFCARKTETLLKQLARTFLIDLKAARQTYARVCKRSYAVPIALRPDLVLLPLRARAARVKDDGTRAYLVKSKIKEILPENARDRRCGTRLVFQDGTTLVLPQRWPSTREVLLAADLVEKEAVSRAGRPLDSRNPCQLKEMKCFYRLCPHKDCPWEDS